MGHGDLLKSLQLRRDMFIFEMVKGISGESMCEVFFRGATGDWGPTQRQWSVGMTSTT